MVTIENVCRINISYRSYLIFKATPLRRHFSGNDVCFAVTFLLRSGVSSLEVPGHPQDLADQLTLSQPEGTNYTHQIILPPGISDLPTALCCAQQWMCNAAWFYVAFFCDLGRKTFTFMTKMLLQNNNNIKKHQTLLFI